MKFILTFIAIVLITCCGKPEEAKRLAAPASTPISVPNPLISFSTSGEQSSLTGPWQLSAFTVTAVFNWQSVAVGNQRIFEKGGAFMGGGFGIESDGSYLACRMWQLDGAHFTEAKAVVPTGVNKSITCSFDGALLRLYLDGILLQSTAATYTTTYENIFIGTQSCNCGGNHSFQGVISKVDLWLSKLSDAQIYQRSIDDL